MSGFAVEVISDDLWHVGWDEASVSGFIENSIKLSELLPAVSLVPDYLNRKSGWTDGEHIDDSEDRLGLQWLYDKGVMNADGIVVAVVDSGIDFQNPDLLSVRYVNPVEIEDGLDNDNNGKIDDLSGWDFLNNDNTPEDLDGHGTAVAAIIGADGTNGTGIAGFAPRCRILSLKFLDELGEGFDSDAIKAIMYASRNGADILNASWGREGKPSPAMRAAVEGYIKSGGIFITSAGNDGLDIDVELQSPASLDLDDMIVVGGSNREYTDLHSSSNYGHVSVDILAPYIWSAPDAGFPYPVTQDGTSFSAAIVSGMAAVIKASHPEFAPGDVTSRLLDTAEFVARSASYVRKPGYPDLRRIHSDKRDPVPSVADFRLLQEGPYHPGERLSFETVLEHEVPFTLLLSNETLFGISLNPPFFAVNSVPEEPAEIPVRVVGVNGQQDHAVQLSPTNSAPYFSSPQPDIVSIEPGTHSFTFDDFRGTRPIQVTLFINGESQLLSPEWVNIDLKFEDMGQHVLVAENQFGTFEHPYLLTYQGKLQIPVPFPETGSFLWSGQYHFITGEHLAIFGGSEFLYHDLEGPYPPPPNRFSVFEDLIVANSSSGVWTSRDAKSWTRIFAKNSYSWEFIGFYNRRFVFVSYHKIILIDPESRTEQEISFPLDTGIKTAKALIAAGETLLFSGSSGIWKHIEEDEWHLIDSSPSSSLPTAFWKDGQFIIFDHSRRVYISNNGIDWQVNVLQGNHLRWRKARNIDGHLLIEDEGILYLFDTLLMEWSPVADLYRMKVLNPDFDVPYLSPPYFISDGLVQAFFERIDVAHTRHDGVFNYYRGTVFSHDLKDWIHVSDEKAAFVQLGDRTLFLDQTGLFEMDALRQIRLIGEGVKFDTENRLYHHGGFLFTYGIKNHTISYLIFDENTGTWLNELETESILFDGISKTFQYRQGLTIRVPKDFAPEALPAVSYLGYRISSHGNSRTLKDMERLSGSTYAVFPHASFSGQSGWFEDPRFGWISPGVGSYIYSSDHGWLYYLDAPGSNAYMYDLELGWIYYDPVAYPLLYSETDARWLYYHKDSRNPRWFYDFHKEDWVSFPRM
jgi:hypothetical protein